MKTRIAVVGAGPVGILITRLLLSRSDIEVTLFEAGGINKEKWLSKENYVMKTPSKLTPGIHKVGGGSNFWKGRMSLFPKSSFGEGESRRKNHWPFSWSEIEEAFSKLGDILGEAFPEDLTVQSSIHVCDACRGLFSTIAYKFVEPTIFLKLFDDLKDAPNLNFRPNTFCLKILADNQTPLNLETIRDFNQSIEMSEEFDFIFVTAGCLQSTAIIQRSFPNLENYSTLGTHLMEHFDGYIGRLVLKRSNFDCLKNFALDYERKLENSEIGVGIRSVRCVNLDWHLEITPLARTYVFDPIVNRFNFPQKLLRVFFAFELMITFPLFRAKSMLDKILGSEVYSIWLKGEEIPFSESKTEIDRNNSRKIIYRHKISRETMVTIRSELSDFKRALRTNNLGKISWAPHFWNPTFISTGGNWHPMGSLRMGKDERAVVKPDMTLISNQNIYVADSSIFPAGGHHNPTSMSLALAVKAVEHLIGRLPKNES